jgi:hypothetical protein
MDVFVKGNAKRATAGTDMNAQSSRSHAAAQFFLSEHPIDKTSEEVLSGKKDRSQDLLNWLKNSVQVTLESTLDRGSAATLAQKRMYAREFA